MTEDRITTAAKQNANCEGFQTLMNKMKHAAIGKIGSIGCAILAGAVTGCVGYVDGPRGGGAYMEPSPVYVEGRVTVQSEYEYYPAYQVYYSSHTRQYVYRE